MTQHLFLPQLNTVKLFSFDWQVHDVPFTVFHLPSLYAYLSDESSKNRIYDISSYIGSNHFWWIILVCLRKLECCQFICNAMLLKSLLIFTLFISLHFQHLLTDYYHILPFPLSFCATSDNFFISVLLHCTISLNDFV